MPASLLLIALMVCHYLADYCLTFPFMIRAKADGGNPWPILLHAGIHAALMTGCLMLWGVGGRLLLILCAVELLTHFLVDWAKGRITAAFPLLSDMKRKPYWMLYGFDQLLHLLVIALIWSSAVDI